MGVLSRVEIYNYLESWRVHPSLNKSNPSALNNCFKELGEMAAQRADGVQIFARFCEILPQEKIEEALKVEHGDNFDSAKKIMQELVDHNAISVKAELANQPSWFWSITVKTWLAGLIFFETVLACFGIAKAFSYSDYSWDTENNLMKPWSNIATFAKILTPLFKKENAQKAAAILAISITVISLAYPYIKPYPPRFRYAANWTQLIKQGKLKTPIGRAAQVDEIVQALRTKKKAMIIGKTGVGKTETVKAFVKAICTEEKYRDFRDKKVIYVNTAEILSNKWTERIIGLIDEIGRHNDGTIIVFDEIHTMCQKRNQLVAQRLKVLLDDETNGIPYAIGVTTEEECNNDIRDNHPAFARRFQLLTFDSTTSEATEEILANHLLKKAPHMIVDPKMLEYLVNQSKDMGVLPYSAINVLEDCISKTTAWSARKESSELENLQLQASTKCKELLLGSASKPLSRTDLSKNIQKAKSDLIEAEGKLKQFSQTRDQYVQAKAKMVESIQKCMLMSYILLPLEKRYEEEGEQLKIPTHLSKELVDAVVEEQLEMQAKAKEAMIAGKKTAAARKIDVDA